MVHSTKQSTKSNTSLIQSILKEIATFQGWELIFKVALSGFILWALYCSKILYDFHTNDKWAHISKSPLSNFKYSIVMAIFFAFYKKACHRMFFNMSRGYLHKDKFITNEDKDARAELHCHWIANSLYYTFSTIACFFLFKEQTFFPKTLGGVGEPLDIGRHWPHAPQIPYGEAFYMIQFGKHLHTFVDYVICKRGDPKFWEMFFHHVLAVFLMFFSYANNHMPVGILVLFVHDPCDVMFCINRMLNDSKYKSLGRQVMAYIFFLGSWMFFRLFAFPRSIIIPSFEYIMTYPVETISMLFYFMAFMLVGLLVLHVYWCIFILQGGVLMIIKKAPEINLYDKKKIKQ